MCKKIEDLKHILECDKYSYNNEDIKNIRLSIFTFTFHPDLKRVIRIVQNILDGRQKAIEVINRLNSKV